MDFLAEDNRNRSDQRFGTFVTPVAGPALQPTGAESLKLHRVVGGVLPVPIFQGQTFRLNFPSTNRFFVANCHRGWQGGVDPPTKPSCELQPPHSIGTVACKVA